ncbi:hypothetical protein ACF061_15550 [Streptomyces sp. NPDC015220]|uniref:AMP-binding enzyme n=1 Tax=Streptomyces sp. NPDC015220 TaxID=3364947 RepID=UPI0037024E6D
MESALLEHPLVAEAGVIGRPDPNAGLRMRPLPSAGWAHDRDPHTPPPPPYLAR